MKIVVTGCAGFIGANFANYWLDRYGEDSVVGVDRMTYAANVGACRELEARERFRLYRADICDAAEMDRIFGAERPDAVVNFAAESHVDRSIEDAGIFVRTNVLGTQVLLDSCLRYGVRFHQISTDEVYGDLPTESEERFSEESRLMPSSPYSASKAAADLLVLSYFKTHGLAVTVSRSANNYGRYQHAEKLIPKVIECAVNGRCVPIYGDGQNVREWIHVEDHCRAVDAILRRGAAGCVYNVGAGVLLSNVELVRRILGMLGRSEELISFVADRKGHDRKYALDCSRITRELGWVPKIDFSEGLADTVSLYKDCLK